MKELLRDPAKRHFILDYARQNYQDESLLFWFDADAFVTAQTDKRLGLAE